MYIKHIASLALALAAATTGGVAQARDVQVQWGVTIGSPVLAIALPPPPPLPFVVVRPRQEVVVLPAPAPVVAYRPVPVGRGWRDSDRDGIPNRYDRHDSRHDNRHDSRRDGWHGR